MGLTRVTEKSTSHIRIGPGDEQTAAILICLMLTIIFAGAAGHGREDPVMLVVLSIVACGFAMVAFFVRNQQRVVEVDLEEQAFFVLGRQRSDMYAIPFDSIAALRVGKFARERSIRPKPQAVAYSRVARPEKDRYFLDILRLDGGYEGIDRSAVAADIQELAELLAVRTGLPLVDDAGFGIACDATRLFNPHNTVAPDSPPPGSILRFHENRRLTSCIWPLSPGPYVLAVMGLFSVGLLMFGALGVYEFSREGGNPWLGFVVSTIAGVFAYQILWRFLRALTCKGFAFLDYEGLHSGIIKMGQEDERFHIPTSGVIGFRVLAPRFGPCVLEALTSTHDRYTLVKVTPGLSPVTVGDLHWLNAKYTEALKSGRFA